MKVNFKSFKKISDVQTFLENQLPISKATVADVIQFLDDLGLKHSEMIHGIELPNTISPSQFEERIVAAATARPTWFILKNEWFMYFMFTNKILVRIAVQEYSIGF